MNFKAPNGLEVPEGTKAGDRFQVLATLELNEDGSLYLCEVDGLPVEHGRNGKKESVPDRAARAMGELQGQKGVPDGGRVNY